MKEWKMDIETQAIYLNLINKDFDLMKSALDTIQERIAQFPVLTQMEFIKTIKTVIFEAHSDACNPDDIFLNGYDGGDRVEISGTSETP